MLHGHALWVEKRWNHLPTPVNMMFARQIDKTMEVYADDMLVKSKDAMDYITHLEESFDILRRYKMRLNLKKCTFGSGF